MTSMPLSIFVRIKKVMQSSNNRVSAMAIFDINFILIFCPFYPNWYVGFCPYKCLVLVRMGFYGLWSGLQKLINLSDVLIWYCGEMISMMNDQS